MLSPTLSNSYSEHRRIIQIVLSEETETININGKLIDNLRYTDDTLLNLRYADDRLLLAECFEDLQGLINSTVEASENSD